MRSGRSAELLAGLLAFLRSRLLGAVLLPALIGAAWVGRRGPVPVPRLLLVLAGLTAAELLNLFGADYAAWRAARRGGAGRGLPSRLALPGNPVVRPSRLPPERIPLVLAPLALAGLAVMLYFTLAVGPQVLAFLLAAALVGALYVLEPFPGAFLATAVIPPLISGGTALALTGEAAGQAFLVGLPVAWISLAVILGYRWAFTAEQRQAGRRWAVVLGLYGMAGVQAAVLWRTGTLPAAALASAPVVLALGALAVREAWRRPHDAVPATALGVLAHTVGSLTLALGLALG